MPCLRDRAVSLFGQVFLLLLQFASRRSSHPGQLRLKVVKVLFVPLDGERLDLVAFSGRLEEHTKGEPGNARVLPQGITATPRT